MSDETRALLTDVRVLLRAFDTHLFVRNTDGDSKPGWAMALLPVLSAMARLQQATDALDGQPKPALAVPSRSAIQQQIGAQEPE